MKRYIAILLAMLTLLLCVSCGKSQQPVPEPNVEELRSICQLSVVEGYFHGVVNYEEKDAEKFLWMKKDKHFWVEYTGIANYGLDASKVKMELSGKEVTISIPKVKLMYCKVDSTSLDDSSYIVDKGSAKITAEDSKAALVKAQQQLEDEASDYQELYSVAQQRAQKLMEDYIENILTASGNNADRYEIKWVYLDET